MRLQQECARARAEAKQVLEKAREETKIVTDAPLDSKQSPESDSGD